MGAPNLENEITGKITQKVIDWLVKTQLTAHIADIRDTDTWKVMLRGAIAEVIAEYFNGDTLLIEDTHVAGESQEAYEARLKEGDRE